METSGPRAGVASSAGWTACIGLGSDQAGSASGPIRTFAAGTFANIKSTALADIFAEGGRVLLGSTKLLVVQLDLADELVGEESFDIGTGSAVAGRVFDDEVGHRGDLLRIGVAEAVLLHFRNEIGQVGQSETDPRILLAG